MGRGCDGSCPQFSPRDYRGRTSTKSAKSVGSAALAIRRRSRTASPIEMRIGCKKTIPAKARPSARQRSATARKSWSEVTRMRPAAALYQAKFSEVSNKLNCALCVRRPFISLRCDSCRTQSPAQLHPNPASDAQYSAPMLAQTIALIVPPPMMTCVRATCGSSTWRSNWMVDFIVSYDPVSRPESAMISGFSLTASSTKRTGGVSTPRSMTSNPCERRIS